MDFKVGDVVKWKSPEATLAKLKHKGPFVVTKTNEIMNWLYYMDDTKTGRPLSMKTNGMPADAWPAMAYKRCEPFMAAVHKAFLQEKKDGKVMARRRKRALAARGDGV